MDKEGSKAELLKRWKYKSSERNSLIDKADKVIDEANSAERRIYLLQKFNLSGSHYHYAHLFEIKGFVDRSKLLSSIDSVWKKNDALRKNFYLEDDTVKYRVTPYDKSSYFTKLVALNSTEQIEAHASKIALESYSLEEDSLARFVLYKIDDQHHVLLTTMHHIVGDRWSLELIQKDILAAYKGINLDHQSVTNDIKPYTEEDLSYWVNKLKGKNQLLALPGIKTRPKTLQFSGKRITKSLSKNTSDRIVKLAQSQNITLYHFILSALNILITKYAPAEYISVGTPVSIRDNLDLEQSVGFYTETIILSNEVNSQDTFAASVQKVKSNFLKDISKRHVPFDKVVKALNIKRESNINPLYQIMYIHEMTMDNPLTLSNLEITDRELYLNTAKVDTTLFSRLSDEHIELTLEYCDEIYDEPSMLRMVDHLINILDSVGINPDIKIAEINILTEAENKLLREELQGQVSEAPHEQPIHSLISKWSTDRPQQIAVSDGSNCITYQELELKANTLANIISNEKSQNPVAILMDRSADYVVAILASLKSGKGYIPLDKSYPIERIKYILQQANVSNVLLNTQEDINIISNPENYEKIVYENINFNENQTYKANVDMGSLAYAIYTSGSTGKPKGVPISNKNLWTSLISRYQFYKSDPDSFLLMSSFAFDSSVAGIYWTLTRGGKLVISPNRIEQDLTALGTLINKEEVTHTLMLPSLYNTLLSYGNTKLYYSLTHVMVAGESCPESLVDLHYKLLPNSILYNEYGPTEGTVWSIATILHKGQKVSIGNAIPYYKIYLLDNNENLVPVGVEGEIYIGGDGVANGYIEDKNQTNERFLANPFHNGKYYKTGDIATYGEDYKIYFKGRKDDQVKVRGHRIELGEIEHALNSVHLNTEWVALPIKDEKSSQTQIVAYHTGERLDDSNINQSLINFLPNYMIPSDYVQIEAMPLLPNSKIDRKELRKKYILRKKKSRTIIEAKTSLENQLLSIWKSTLGNDIIGVTDNFFALGGDSIMSIKMISVAKDNNLILSPQDIFEYQTIKSLAQHLEQNKSKSPQSIEIIKEDNESLLTDIQQALYFVSQSKKEDPGVLQLDFRLAGNIDKDNFDNSWKLAADRHTILRTYIAEKDSKLYIIIDDQSEIDIEYHNISNYSTEDQKKYLKSHSKHEYIIDLSSQRSNKVHLFQTAKDQYTLRWICHHIYLDGMSCAIIIQDVLKYYLDNNVKLSKIHNYPTYVNWHKQQDQSKEKDYWISQLNHLDKAYLLKNKLNTKAPNLINNTDTLSKEKTKKIENFCQANNISKAIFFQSCWSILLSKIFNSNEIVSGITVTGRNRDFPNIEISSGLYMNVAPEKIDIPLDSSISDWMKKHQSSQGLKRKMEHTKSNDIVKFINWPQSIDIFDSLFVYGNFMAKSIKIGAVEILDFKGGFTSTYPLTLRVNPTIETELAFLIDQNSIDEDMTQWIPIGFNAIIEAIINGAHSVKDIKSSPPEILQPTRVTKEDSTYHLNEQSNLSLHDKMRLIWNEIFGRVDIEDHQSFFAIGGKSLHSIKLVNLIEARLNRTIVPSKILQYPSISALSNYLEQGETNVSEEMLIQMKKGKKNAIPLICFHAGGSQIFFYKTFSDHLHEDIPVFSVQPPDIDSSIYPKSIEEMTQLYIKEISKIYPSGPINILTTCFSNTIAVEMANQLKTRNTKVNRILIIDSAPNTIYSKENVLYSWLPKYIWYNIKNKQIKTLLRKLRLLPQQSLNTAKRYTGSENEKINRSVDQLNEMYTQYEWQRVNQKIDFIRTTEKLGTGKDFHIKIWKYLSSNQLNIHTVQGKHLDLWEGEIAKQLAQIASDILLEK